MGFIRTAVLTSATVLLFTSSALATTIVNATGSGGTILDHSTLTLSVNVTDDETILGTGQNVTLSLIDFVHTWAGDVSVSLTHDGITAYAFNRVGAYGPYDNGSDSDFRGTYRFNSDNTKSLWSAAAEHNKIPAGNYYATSGGSGRETSFSDVWNGQSVAGLWTLQIRDWNCGDTGSLNKWTLSIGTGDPVVPTPDPSPTPEPATTALLAAGVGGLGLLRRKIASR